MRVLFKNFPIRMLLKQRKQIRKKQGVRQQQMFYFNNYNYDRGFTIHEDF